MRQRYRSAAALVLGVLFSAAPATGFQTAPEAERGLVLRSDGSFEGYTLFAPLRSTSTYLIDAGGAIAHEWKSAYAPGNSVYLLANGNLLRCAREQQNPVFHGGGQGGRIQELRWGGAVLWDYVVSDETRMHHHDIEPLPNGNVLLIVWEQRTREAALDAGRDEDRVVEGGLWPDAVLEVEPVRVEGGRVVWEWHAWDHLVQDRDPTKPHFGKPSERPERIDVNADHRYEDTSPPADPVANDDAERRRHEQMRQLGYVGDDDEDDDGNDDAGGRGADGDGGADRNRRSREGSDWLHTNSVSYAAEHDLIVLSTREMSEIWVIDHSTTTAEAAGSRGGRYGRGGDLLARWGNPQNHGAGKAADRRLYVQHDARWVPSGDDEALHVLVFNNGRGRPEGEFSSVDEIALPFDRETGFGPPPADPVWSYAAPDRESFYSSFISGADRLPNGNTLVCSGAQGRVFEVAPGGEIVWDYLNPFGGEVPLHDGPPRDRRPGPPGGPGGPGGPGRRGGDQDIPKGLFRATRIAPDHPGLALLPGRDG